MITDISKKLSPDLVRCIFCHPLHFCALAVHISTRIAAKLDQNPICFGNSRDHKIPTISQKLTQQLHFLCFPGKHASGLAQRDNHIFTWQEGLFLPYTDSLSTSILKWQRDSVLPPDLPTRPSFLATNTACMKLSLLVTLS